MLRGGIVSIVNNRLTRLEALSSANQKLFNAFISSGYTNFKKELK